jgi:hypothetical protein
MTLTHPRRRFTARAFLALALLAALGAAWMPCTQALAGDMSHMAHHGHDCGHCPGHDGPSPDGIARAASPHCVDVARGSPDARGAGVAILPALAPAAFVFRLAPERVQGAATVPDPGPPVPARALHLEKSVLLI